jgi:LPPG:FO 2-phospho-L-lactate transferase
LKVVALAGGTGSAKLLRGLLRLGVDLTVVANVGDNIWIYGVYVCPDIDIACYSLAGIADAAKGWGIEGDTFEVLRSLEGRGVESWFRLGDRDLATCMQRTEMMRAGATLTDATDSERKSLGLKCRVLPVTDDSVETRIDTSKGDIHLQEFWVKEKGRPRASGVRYKGARNSRVTPQVVSAVSRADRVVICPANPVTSIGPMLAVPGFARLLSQSKARVVALSPMEGSAPFSGPAGKLMKATGTRQDSVGVARFYSTFLDGIIISEGDLGLRRDIKTMGVTCLTSNTRIESPKDELRLAKELMRA